ncbi:MAG TPA: hypothetical protein VK892_22130 [Pyrinomonadaceae bacterium]|nr:hypothetical protein [Pyrinomonadaceae bacterium]
MGVVLLAMTIGGFIIAAGLLAVSYFARLNWLKTFVLGGIAVWLTGYVILLFVGSFFSEEKTLGMNEPKEFCGFYLDCHLRTAVTDVRKTKTYGNVVAEGEFYVVKVKVLSDAKQATLNLTDPRFHVYDATGRSYNPVENPMIPPPSFDDKVPAGGSFEKEVVFDLPKDVNNPRLDIREGFGVDRVVELILIGDEDSILHKRNYFRLNPGEQVASK